MWVSRRHKYTVDQDWLTRVSTKKSVKNYICSRTDPDKNLLLLLGLLIDAQRAVFLGGSFLHSACTHVPPPPTKQLNGMGQCGAFVPAVLLTEMNEERVGLDRQKGSKHWESLTAYLSISGQHANPFLSKNQSFHTILCVLHIFMTIENETNANGIISNPIILSFSSHSLEIWGSLKMF